MVWGGGTWHQGARGDPVITPGVAATTPEIVRCRTAAPNKSTHLVQACHDGPRDRPPGTISAFPAAAEPEAKGSRGRGQDGGRKTSLDGKGTRCDDQGDLYVPSRAAATASLVLALAKPTPPLPARAQSPFGNAKPREAVIAGRVGKTEEEVLKEEVKSTYKLHVSPCSVAWWAGVAGQEV